jgi:galactokinase
MKDVTVFPRASTTIVSADRAVYTDISSPLRVSTPGRICLFGEHQDYLHLPVIPCAISLRIELEGSSRSDKHVAIDLPDIGSCEEFSLEGPLDYPVERAYFRSAVNVVRREGFTFSRGFTCRLHGVIPINSGTSSSSALIVTWINFLARMSDQHAELSAYECARLAHAAEVLEFREPGGMMDHFSTAYGGTIVIDFFPEVKVERLNAQLGTFVLGDSGEPKDTQGILARVKHQVLAAASVLGGKYPDFSLRTVRVEDLERYRGDLTPAQLAVLQGTVRNRDITARANALLRELPLDHRKVGALLTEHQSILRDVLRISTPKIDRMLSAATDAGAYGGKINGSGGGGCMFVYAPENSDRVARAIEQAGGTAYVVTPDAGTRVEPSGASQ